MVGPCPISGGNELFCNKWGQKWRVRTDTTLLHYHAFVSVVVVVDTLKHQIWTTEGGVELASYAMSQQVQTKRIVKAYLES